jgi:hypothetical protein
VVELETRRARCTVVLQLYFFLGFAHVVGNCNLQKEAIAPTIQNLVDDVQIHTKSLSSLSHGAKPC